MKRLKNLLPKALLGFALVILITPFANAFTLEDIDRSFYPYKDGVPTFDGLKVGMDISSENVDKFKPILDNEMFKFIKEGWVVLKVGETVSFDLHENYIKATKEGLGKVKLGAEVGQIEGFVAGRPFPEEPDINDSRAGEKLAWNFKYGYNWGDNAAIYSFYWKYRDIKKSHVERNITFHQHFLNFKHRVNQDPKPEITPNPSGLFRAIYMKVLEPYDVANTQLLIQRSSNDQKRDNAWLYLGFQRRVRRLATGQVTDAYLGSDMMIEDMEGYNGRVSDMNWTFKGAKNLLVPFYKHNELPQLGLPLDSETHKDDPDGFQVVAYGGKGGCFPNVTYQLRKIYLVEAVPVDPNHPISRRVHYMDAQTFVIPKTNVYDRSGKFWKTLIIGQAHPDYHLALNKGSGVSLDDAFTMIDVQALHCTTGQFKGQVDPALTSPDLFTVQNLRATGK